MTSGCKVGVLIPELVATSAAALGAVFGQRSGNDIPYSCAKRLGWLQRITTPHRGFLWL